MENLYLLCKEYGIENYHIVDGRVNVRCGVNLCGKYLKQIPIGIVTGNFYISRNNLVTLDNSPHEVGGNMIYLIIN